MIPMLRNLLSGACLAIKPLYIVHFLVYICHWLSSCIPSMTNDKCKMNNEKYLPLFSFCLYVFVMPRVTRDSSRAKGCAAHSPRHYRLPAIMRERFIGLSHSMH